MKVLLLSPYPENLIKIIKLYGDKVLVSDKKINLEFIKKNDVNYLISYGYKYIINEKIINYMSLNMINLHISFLPYNRGYYPNLWAHIDNTISGVTIQRVGIGIDQGEILVRKKIKIDIKSETLRSSYKLLREKIELLFQENWLKIRSNEIKSFVPDETGSFHLKKEGDKILEQLVKGWDTKIVDLKKYLIENIK